MTIRKTLLLFCFCFAFVFLLTAKPATTFAQAIALVAHGANTGSAGVPATVTLNCSGANLITVNSFDVIPGPGGDTSMVINSTSAGALNFTLVPGGFLGADKSHNLLWWGFHNTLSATETVSVFRSLFGAHTIDVSCWSNVASASQVDVAVSTHTCGDGSTNIGSCTSPTVTPSNGGDLIITTGPIASGGTVTGGSFISAATCGTALCLPYWIQTTPTVATMTYTFNSGFIPMAIESMSFFAQNPPTDYTVSGTMSGYVFSPSGNLTFTKGTGNFDGSTQTITITDNATTHGTVVAVSNCTVSGSYPWVLTPTGSQNQCVVTYQPAVTSYRSVYGCF
jgi:hypothetical protein